MPFNWPINWFPHCSFLLLHTQQQQKRDFPNTLCGADNSHNRAFLQLSNIAHTIIVLYTTMRQILHLISLQCNGNEGQCSISLSLLYAVVVVAVVCCVLNRDAPEWKIGLEKISK